jgi:hypothetical protein
MDQSLKRVPTPSHILLTTSNFQRMSRRVFRTPHVHRIFFLQQMYRGPRVGWSQISLVRDRDLITLPSTRVGVSSSSPIVSSRSFLLTCGLLLTGPGVAFHTWHPSRSFLLCIIRWNHVMQLLRSCLLDGATRVATHFYTITTFNWSEVHLPQHVRRNCGSP